MKSMYVVFARPFNGDHSYHQPSKDLVAFPDAVREKSKSSVQGGGGRRKRWKDRKGRIYEWDSENGNVEVYDRQRKHQGEIMHLCITGFLIDDSNDGSLKYERDVQPEHEQAVIDVMGWGSLAQSPDGEWPLTDDQAQRIASVINDQFPIGLDVFIGLEA